MASDSNADTAPTDISGPLLIGILLSTLLFGIVLGLSFQYLSAVSRSSKLAPESCLARKSSRSRLVAILNARLKRQVPSFFFGEHAFRTFTVLALHLAGLSQTIIRFYLLWQLAIVQSHLDLSLNPFVIPFGKVLFPNTLSTYGCPAFLKIGSVRTGVAISSNLLTLMIQTIVQISLLKRAQKLDRIATYSAALATERDQNHAISLSSDTHSIRIEPGEEEDNEWLFALRHRRLITHSLYLQQGSSAWRWKSIQLLIGICAATGVASAVLNTIGPFERHQGIALSNTSSLVNQKAGSVTLITPIWYMLSAIVDVLISASTIRDLGKIRNQVLNICNNRNDRSNVNIGGISEWCANCFHHSVLLSTREGVAITLITVLTTSLRSQESRNCKPPDAYPLKSSSTKRLQKSSITNPGSEGRSSTRPPRSMPAAMIRENTNLSLTYDSSDTHLDCENVLSIHYSRTSHDAPPQLRVSSQSPETSLTSWCTWGERGPDPDRLSPNSSVSRLSASTINSKPEYPLHSRFSDWGSATPETATFRSTSTMS
ncbi:uncharacterized protein MELLADRAFT_101615 [Melampsora larici-populina 98AG31]|uniref:Uncharacterized protein n=1 Tax=Melampsora larici-populina (strain 98AG31 / pathotype 3-4-7) TaxID=747676 RepID=F4R6E9_MELLP|nr:uncharacterized protein MELLADRAFT_101615 [Melampsora larici-populina 98AG31]EGG12473.1 hypothetical protein MELLADRAFT_101615 [Melampsora larici-populina 98AG31]